MSDFNIGEIPADHAQRDVWRGEVAYDSNGDIAFARFSSKYGELRFGQRPEGFIGWAFKEPGGGGSITIPYTFDSSGELFIGLLWEDRQNMGGKQLCIPGGMLDPGESHDEAQEREFLEETGIDSRSSEELDGLPLNSNRLFFIADPAKGEGVYVYALEVPVRVLKKTKDGLFRFGDLSDLAKDRLAKAANVEFMQWKDAVAATADSLALSAIARLVARLM